jgi:hypothetical protein
MFMWKYPKLATLALAATIGMAVPALAQSEHSPEQNGGGSTGYNWLLKHDQALLGTFAKEHGGGNNDYEWLLKHDEALNKFSREQNGGANDYDWLLKHDEALLKVAKEHGGGSNDYEWLLKHDEALNQWATIDSILSVVSSKKIKP